MIQLQQILVATDFSEVSSAAIDYGHALARTFGAMAHLLLGSVAEKVVRTAPCPVLTVRHPEREFVTPDTLDTTLNTQPGGRS